MRLSGSRISTSLPIARASGFRQRIHRFGPLASEKESHSLCLGDFFHRENEQRNLIAPVAVMPRRTRSFSTGTPLSPIDARQEIFELVTKRLVRLAHDFPIQLPPSEVSLSRVRRLMWLMETQGAVEIPTDKQAVDRFFNEAVEPCVGAELTQDSSYAGLVTFCKVRKWPRCSRAYFDRAATKRFGETSHCYGEKGTLRGRVGWRLRQDAISRPASQHDGHMYNPNPDGQTPNTYV